MKEQLQAEQTEQTEQTQEQELITTDPTEQTTEQEQEQEQEVATYTLTDYLKTTHTDSYSYLDKPFVVVNAEGEQYTQTELKLHSLAHHIAETYINPLANNLTQEEYNRLNTLTTILLTTVNKADAQKAAITKHLQKLAKVKQTIYMLYQDDNQDLAELTSEKYQLNYQEVIEEMKATTNNSTNTNTATNNTANTANTNTEVKKLNLLVAGQSITPKGVRFNAFELATKLTAKGILPAGSKGSAIKEVGIDLTGFNQVGDTKEFTVNGTILTLTRIS